MSETRRIYNTHGQLSAAGGGIAIVKSYGGIRDKFVDGWEIVHTGADRRPIPTDPKAPWYRHGAKWFSSFSHDGTFHDRQRAALAEAQAWVADTYGERGPWARNAQGDFVPARIQKAHPIKRQRQSGEGQ
jgi:hypothetical protein